jgi:acetyl esterase/lipase
MAPIHPELMRRLIDPVRTAPINPMDIPIAERRAAAEAAWLPQKDQEKVARIIDQQVDDFSVQIYIPHGEAPLPVCLWFHGGGGVFGSVGGSAPLARKVAERTPCIVVNVEYALAPEHPYPSGLQQCYRALEWTYANIAQFRGDPKRLAVAGDSMGGNLAAGVALMARDRGGPPLVFQLLIYPNSSFEVGESEDKWFVTPEVAEWYYERYYPTEEARDEPYAMPLNHPSFQDLPPAYFIFAEYDILTKGGLDFLDRLDKEGVAATGRVYEGMLHGFVSLLHDFPPGDDALNEGIMHLREEFER